MIIKQAQAHETYSDAGIEATMHIDPGHHPIIGQEAKFFFTFKDPSGLFGINRCDCSITLLKDEKQLDRQPFAATNGKLNALGTDPLYKRTFTEPGEYEIRVTGNPKDGATFHSFELEYPVTTASDVNATMNEAQHQTMTVEDHDLHTEHSAWHTQHLGHLIIFGGGFVVAIGLLIRNYLETRKNKNTKENS